MPRKFRRLGPRWTIPAKLALRARWTANRPAMLARSKAGTEASRRTYAQRLDALRAIVASWPSDLSMQDICAWATQIAWNGRSLAAPPALTKTAQGYCLDAFPPAQRGSTAVPVMAIFDVRSEEHTSELPVT